MLKGPRSAVGGIPTRAPHGTFSDWPNARKPKFKELISRILDQLPLLKQIEELPFRSVQLQYFEAEIIKKTMLELIRHFECPALPVHDCLIVQKRNAKLAGDILRNRFHGQVGVWPRIHTK
jgi:hypothetical protein